MIQEKKKHRKSSRKPSAMAQVHNRVNAGIMDGVTCCGMMEGAEPEMNEYILSGEKDAPVGGRYYHVTNENRKTMYITEEQFKKLKKLIKESATDKEKWFLRIYAVNTYGTTDSFDSAGFILTNGELLDFGNYDDIYRQAHGALDLKGKNFRDFINAGNIRVNPQSPGIEFCEEPTEEQYEKIAEMTEHYTDRGVFYVDCVDGDGKNIWNKEYDDEEIENAVDDIKKFFKDGVNPGKEGNDVLMGYSLKDFLEESTAKKSIYDKYIKSLINFMREQKLRIDPLPEIELNPEEQDGIFVKTGYYSPDEKKVVVFIDQRHPKDVLRTVAHEFVHHMQNLQDPNKDWSSGGDLEDDRKLRAIEGEAFLLGNIIFREWTEKMKRTGELNESRKQRKNDNDEIVPKTCDKCGGKVVLQIHGEPVYVCKDCGKYFGTMPFNLNENVEAEIVEPDEVDLSSFNIKKHLNPKFWDDGHLDTRIRLKLLDIADDFFHSLDVDWVEPEDVIITGSLANYNWNKKYSDIDLHILVDYEDVDERTDFVREYFTMKKNEWNRKHEGLKIFGFPVEVYVQDSNEPHASSGVYSIDRDEWITEPDIKKIRSGKVDKKHVRETISTYMNKIDALIDIYKKHKDDKYEMKKVSDEASDMLGEIKKMRKDDLQAYGREMCDGNIIFKALRRSDYIGKLIKLRDLTYNKINSL